MKCQLWCNGIERFSEWVSAYKTGRGSELNQLVPKTLNCACGVGCACSGVGMKDRPQASSASSDLEGVQLPLVNIFMYCDSPAGLVALVPFRVPVLLCVGGRIVEEVVLQLLGGCW